MSIVAKGGTIIRIEDMKLFADRIKTLQGHIPRMMRDSIEDALTNGDSEILADIWARTPQSDRARYAYRYKAIERDDWKDDGSALRAGWRKKLREANGSRAVDRVDMYGMQRLRKAVFGGQDTYGVRGMKVSTTYRSASFAMVVDSVPYARRMHEAVDIVDYWSGRTARGIGDKRGKGWSTQGTGAKFLTDPVADKKGDIRTDVRNALAYRLEEAMR